MRCYLCSSTQNLTKDHIPPRGFFPQPRPTDLITISCCAKCNNAFSKDDEAVRLWLSAHIARSPAGEWIWEKKVLPNTAKRSPSLIDQMLNSTRDAYVQTPAGPTEAVSFEIDSKRVSHFMIRIVKGLLARYHSNYDYSGAVFDVRLIESDSANLNILEELRDQLPYDSRGEGVFQFRGGLTDSQMSGIWLLLFYEASLFLVAHTNNNWGRGS